MQTIFSGPDVDWSSSVKKCFQQINHEYVLVLFDDVFFVKAVDENKIEKLFGFVDHFRPNYLKFTPAPAPDIKINEDIGKYKSNTLYRNSLMSIWNRTLLLDLLLEGESAWSFETDGGFIRSQKYENFLCCYDEYFEFLHGVEKGLWYKKAANKLTKMGLQLDFQARGILNGSRYFKSQLSLVRRILFVNSPAWFRPYLLNLSQSVRSRIYKKW